MTKLLQNSQMTAESGWAMLPWHAWHTVLECRGASTAHGNTMWPSHGHLLAAGPDGTCPLLQLAGRGSGACLVCTVWWRTEPQQFTASSRRHALPWGTVAFGGNVVSAIKRFSCNCLCDKQKQLDGKHFGSNLFWVYCNIHLLEAYSSAFFRTLEHLYKNVQEGRNICFNVNENVHRI